MTTEQQVTSLEISKKLKELGVEQESKFYWTRPQKSPKGYVCWYESQLTSDEVRDWEYISAFTASELGEILPSTIKIGRGGAIFEVEIGFSNKFYGDDRRLFYCAYRRHNDIRSTSIWTSTLADAMGKMLQSLKEKGLI